MMRKFRWMKDEVVGYSLFPALRSADTAEYFRFPAASAARLHSAITSAEKRAVSQRQLFGNLFKLQLQPVFCAMGKLA